MIINGGSLIFKILVEAIAAKIKSTRDGYVKKVKLLY